MSRTTRTIVTVAVAVIVVVLLALAYIWFSGGSGAPSATLSAPTLAVSTQAPTTAPTVVPTAETATAETATAETAAAAGTLVVFNIASDQSQVSFTLTEELRGQPTTVVGTTDQVAGQIGVNFASPHESQVGEIRINARTLATDQEMRNRTIRGQILQSAQDQYEFISFKPTALAGLPDSVTIGTPFSFQLTGDLTIRDVTKPITFEVTVSPDSDAKISGTAKTTVQRANFGLTIPNVPMVANVSEDVQLQIDFVALPA